MLKLPIAGCVVVAPTLRATLPQAMPVANTHNPTCLETSRQKFCPGDRLLN
ncbi:MAG: hypothetical protein RLZZ490_1323 [Cyanobacteriota bacterium]|jgi:hypothetical protein